MKEILVDWHIWPKNAIQNAVMNHFCSKFATVIGPLRLNVTRRSVS
jgi:hypothetical protein